MKLKSLVFGLCLSLVGHAFAANQHLHPKANEVNNTNKNSVVAQASMYPGNCEIEVINSHYNHVWVYGTFDDGTYLNSFKVYAGDAPHYIGLYYYGYCHAGMNLTIEEIKFPLNRIIYTAWTSTQSTVRIVPPYLTNNLNGKNDSDKSAKVEVAKK